MVHLGETSGSYMCVKGSRETEEEETETNPRRPKRSIWISNLQLLKPLLLRCLNLLDSPLLLS